MRKMKFLASLLAAAMVVTTVPYSAPVTTNAAIAANEDVVMNGKAITGYDGDAKSLTRMIIPETATSIERGAFYSDVYPNLVEMVIRNDNITIKDKAFGYDSKGVIDGDLVVWCNKGSTAETYAKKIGATVKYLNNDDISIVSGSSVYYSGCKSFDITSTVPISDEEGREGDVVWRIDDAAYKAGTMWFMKGSTKVQEISGDFTKDGNGATTTSTARVYVLETDDMKELTRTGTVTADCRGTGASDSKTYEIRRATSTIKVKATIYEPLLHEDERTKAKTEEGVELGSVDNQVYFAIKARKVKEEMLSGKELAVYVQKGYLVEINGVGDDNNRDSLSNIMPNSKAISYSYDHFEGLGRYYSDVDGKVVSFDSKKEYYFSGLVDSAGNMLSDNIGKMYYINTRTTTDPTIKVISNNNVLAKVVSLKISIPADEFKMKLGDMEVKEYYTYAFVEGMQTTLDVNSTPGDTTYVPYWESSDETVARIVENKINFVRHGDARITCTLKDKITGEAGISSHFYVSVAAKVLYSGIAFVDNREDNNVINECYVENGKTYTLSVRDVKNGSVYVPGSDETEANEELVYDSSKPSVATVSEDGVIKGVSSGKTTITVYAKEHPTVKASIVVNVYAKATAINFEKNVGKVVVGQSELIPYKLGPVDSTEEVVWTVENSDKAKAEEYVDEQGKRFVKITGKIAGNTTLTGTTVPSKATKSIPLYVENAVHADTLKLIVKDGAYKEETDGSEIIYKINKGDTITLAAELKSNDPNKVVNDKIEWMSEAGQKVAAVSVNDTDDCVIKGTGAGEFGVTLNAKGYTSDGKEVIKTTIVRIKVVIPATSISIKAGGTVAEYYDLEIGSESLKLTGEVLPTSCTEDIKWKVSDTSIASLTLTTTKPKGNTLLVPKKTGKVVVTAETESGIKKTIEVNVCKPAKDVKFICDGKEVTTVYVPVNGTKKVNLKIGDTDTTDKSFTWKADDAAGSFTIEKGTDGLYATIRGVACTGTPSNITVKGESTQTNIGKAFTLKVVVFTPADSIQMANSSYEIYKGTKTININATMSYNDGDITPNDVVSWTVDDESIVKITGTKDADANGNVSATIQGLAAGTTKITATTSTGKKAQATITVKAKSFNEDSAIITVSGKKVGEAKFEATYNGSENEPAITVKVKDKNDAGKDIEISLNRDTDYTVNYVNNVNAGEATVEIAMTDDCIYSGKVSVTFTIKPKALPSPSNVKISDAFKVMQYGGEGWSPDFTYVDGTKELVKDTDFTVKYEKNIDAGTANIILTGKGNYTGTKSKTFTIIKKDLSTGGIKVTGIKNATYSGANVEQKYIVVKYGEKLTLKKDADYSIVYKNAAGSRVTPKNVGTYYVYIQGKGANYTGELKVGSFKINPKSISGASVAGIVNQNYTGTAIKKAPIVKDLIGGRTASIAYNKDYTLSWYSKADGTKCIKPGVVTITIKGKGNYTGTKTATYVILPPAVKNLKMASNTTKSVKITWSKALGANGYNIYLKSGRTLKKIGSTTSNSYNITKLAAGKDYSYRVIPYVKSSSSRNVESTKYTDVTVGTKPANAVISKITTKSKAVNLTLKKITGATTYEVYYATSKNGKYKKAKTTSTTVAAVTGLTKGKTYYFKVRAGRKIGGKLYYGGYSSVKSIKVK